MHIDKTRFYEAVGGEAALATMSDEQKADAVDDYLLELLNSSTYPEKLQVMRGTPSHPPTIRRGTGAIFGDGQHEPLELVPLPPQPTLLDFFRWRLPVPFVRHMLQSAGSALAIGATEEQVLACFLHDIGQCVARVDHGWWGAQMVEPYVSEKVAFAVRFHQALRFYPDESVGYHYPELYVELFGEDYVPEPYIHAAYEHAKAHRYYMEARMVTVHDLYAFDPDTKVELEPFTDIVGRHFRQPEEGLGFDNSPVAHIWRSLSFPDHPL